MLSLSTLALSFAPDTPPALSFDLLHDGTYSLLVGKTEWYRSAKQTVCSAGADVSLAFSGTKDAKGHDAFGDWAGTTASYLNASIRMDITFKRYAAASNFLVGTASFPAGLNTSGCGSNQQISTRFPSFNTSAARASTLDTLSWRAGVISITAVAKGLDGLGATGLDCGPVVSTDSSVAGRPTVVWSTLDNHKIVPQETANGTYSMGIAAAIPSLPAGFEYSILFTVADGGATAGTYFWGELIQGYHGISRSARLPSVTLSNVGYYTDDGAYYYVWGGNVNGSDPELSSWIPRRPWPAEEGLLLVEQALREQGVPIGYMQLDDWWYSGRFFFGNVKAVSDWHASNSSGLFPRGLPAFARRLGLPLQLYTPFFDDRFATPHRTFESSSFGGTKLPVPDDSYAFFADLFDLGVEMTGGRFEIYEIDFLDANFAGCVACFADTTAAERWYRGMAEAALERNISIQYCLPSATDMLAALSFPAVVQARASGDYAREEGNMDPDGNVVTLGGASLLLGATAIAPSKDTLWTRSPQPSTSSDRTHSGARTAPHVQLDALLATLSLGPVGISDGLNQTDVGLIGQAYRSKTDGTLLRPSRPLSTIDAVWTNYSNAPNTNWSAPNAADIARGISGGSVSDVRATHAAVGDGDGRGRRRAAHLSLRACVDDDARGDAAADGPLPAAAARRQARRAKAHRRAVWRRAARRLRRSAARGAVVRRRAAGRRAARAPARRDQDHRHHCVRLLGSPRASLQRRLPSGRAHQVRARGAAALLARRRRWQWPVRSHRRRQGVAGRGDADRRGRPEGDRAHCHAEDPSEWPGRSGPLKPVWR